MGGWIELGAGHHGARGGGRQGSAAPLPLTSLADDVAALNRSLDRAEGPVVLAGHAYAGAVIALARPERVKALVYVTALAPDEGENVADVFYRLPPHPQAPKLAPDSNGLIWLPEDAFASAFAQHASADDRAVLAAVQRPISLGLHHRSGRASALEGRSGWFLVAEDDRMIVPETQRFMAERMKATIQPHAVDHTPSVTAPAVVVDIIGDAIRIAMQSAATVGKQILTDTRSQTEEDLMKPVKYRTADVDGFKIFYREAGPADAPKLLLLHGFPSASHMFRDLIPLLPDRFHIVAPDLPGFGQSDMPARDKFSYTFDNIAGVIERFTEVIGFDRFAVYVFDYGAPTGFRLAVRHPERITAIISQNGNAYEEGLSDGWTPIRAYWQDPSQANRKALRAFLSPETTRWQYTHGVPEPAMVSPDGQNLDNFYLARPGADEVQLDLFGDYKSNVALYPSFQQYFRTHKPPLLGGVGQERSVLPAAGRRGVQARHSRRRGPLLRHRPLRAGNPCRRNRAKHP